MEVVMEHKIDSSMDTFFGKLSLSPNLVSDQDTLSVFSYVKFLERKASILEDIVNTSHTLAEINQTLTSNHNCSLDETAAIKCIDVGVQTETVNQCECHIAPPEPLDIVTLSSSDLDVDVDEEQSDPKAADLLSKFSPISISSLSSIAISDIDVLETEPPACGYVPYEMNKPFPIRQQRPAENNGQRMKPKNSPQKNMYQTLSADKPDTLFISSSMFRNLNENMMSSSKHTAKVLFYPGANSYEMLQRLLKDDEFYTLDKSAIKQIFVLTGSNYIESLASGNLPFENATSGVNSLCFKLWETFVNAKISMINILPRADRCRNSYVMKLNDYIKKLCQSHGLSFVDTEFKNRLFSEFNGSRKQQYFKSGYFDDVHLNTKGIARLGRHLKYLAHIG
ncbi:hypothetical protein ACHWQZ_G017098 [Mnemiopsis leidyi]